ncbi:kell blood group glycoprotein isoform X2 [Oncorhynchus kisutch]|uniref:kell blood group glycoprotein isoform X2 n=1 Tax=Oncorhynchus kisutch TaxID=8019 RepID=UPI0012DDDED3|nr:kell blood group glycoprotein isoform X2 [Oncorhynchus kisutch]
MRNVSGCNKLNPDRQNKTQQSMAETPAEPQIDCELQPPSNTLSEPQLQYQLHPLSEPQPLPQPDTLPLPQPQPDSLPGPQLLPQPWPLPQPQPDSLPGPQLLPQPDTLPQPWPLPQPQPDSLPEPQLLPQPDTLPEPQPLPQPDTLPQPLPQPQPDSLPEPQLLPQPDTLPEPQPLPQPDTIPQPLPQPQPDSLPGPQLLPQPDTLPEPQPPPEEEVKPWVWKRHCVLLLFLLASSFCASIVGLAYYSQQHLPPESTPPASPPCTSPACQRATARLSISVDPFSQPCDYFLFPCGSEGASLSNRGRQRGKGMPLHPQGHKSRAAQAEKERERGRKERETGTDIIEKAPADRMPDRQTALLLTMREILAEDRSSPGNSARKKACMFYRSCMDTGPTESAGPEPFLRLVHKLGGWAVSGRWNQTDFNSTLSLLMRDYGTFPFFSVYVGKDPNDTQGDKRYIQIDQPDFQIPTEWSSKTQKSKANTQILRLFLASYQRLLALLGSPSSSTILHIGLFISLSSELAVAASPLPHRLQQGLLYQRITIKELQTLAPAIDWLGCLQTTFHPHPVSQSDHVLLHNLPYIVHMSRIIGKWLNKHELSGSGPLHTFMVLSLLHTVIPALDSRFTQTERNFSLALGTTEEDVPRWRQCVLQTEKGFDTVLKHILRETTAYTEAEELIQNVYSSIKSKLPDLRWRDEESRLSVLNKIQSLTPRLSTKNNIFSEAELNQLYSKVTIDEHMYFSNYIQSLSLQRQRPSKLFSQAEGDDIWSLTPFISGNELVFPIGMFVQPLFHPTYPRAINFGVLGSLMAKDILHLLLPNSKANSLNELLYDCNAVNEIMCRVCILHMFICVYACVCRFIHDPCVCRFIHDPCVCRFIHDPCVCRFIHDPCVCPDCSPCALVHSQSVSPRSIAECVRYQYLSMTEGPGREGAFSLSPAQQQEMWVQYSALQIALQAYNQSLKKYPGDSSLSGLSHTHLFLTSFTQINCDSDPYHEFMPFEPSFLVTVICGYSNLCPTTLSCPNKPQQHLLGTC